MLSGLTANRNKKVHDIKEERKRKASKSGYVTDLGCDSHKENLF